MGKAFTIPDVVPGDYSIVVVCRGLVAGDIDFAG